MNFRSVTTGASSRSLIEAVLNIGASGMMMPESMPRLPRAVINNMPGMKAAEIGYVVASSLFGSEVPAQKVKDVVSSALSFDMPLVEIDRDIYALELFHGPTMTVKDLGARFIARLLNAVGAAHPERPLNVMVASSGNSGSAVANGSLGVKGINVCVLYPVGTPRSVASRFTALGSNVHAIEVDGTLEDCNRMMQQLLADPDMAQRTLMTSAGSANIGRILAQTLIFFHAWARMRELTDGDAPVRFSIPTGTGGTLLSCLMARDMGLDMQPPVAACNANAAIARYAESQPYAPKAVHTAAYAIDTATLANAPRLDAIGARGRFVAQTVSDDEISDTILTTLSDTGRMLDPHAATALAALRQHMRPGEKGIVLATAHPALSIDQMTRITGRAIELPLALTRFMSVRRPATRIAPTYPALKRYLTHNL